MLEGAVPDRIRGSYLAKFAVAFGVVLVVAGSVSAASYADISGDLQRQVQSDLQEQAQVEAEELSGWVKNQKQRTRMLSSHQVMTGDPARIQVVINEELQQLPAETHGIHYVDVESGEIEQSTDNAWEGRSLDSDDIRWNTRAGGDVVEVDYESLQSSVHGDGTVYSNTFERDGTHLIAFYSPIYDATNQATGKAIVVTVDARVRAGLFRNPIEGGTTRVVDGQSGEIMFSLNGSELGTAYAGGEDARVFDSTAGVFEREATDEIVAFRRVPETNWVVVKRAPRANAYAVADSARNSILLIVAIALGGFVVVGATLGRNTARELDDLAGQASALAAGRTDLDFADDDRIDEVGRVREAFGDTQSYLRTVSEQADAIARQEFDDPALDEDVPGDLGASLSTMRANLEEFIEDLEASREATERAQEEAEQLAADLERQAEEFGDVMETAADGDLTVRLEEDVDSEAMAEIATAFNGMLDDLEGTVAAVAELADEVDRATVEVDDGVDEIEAASREVGDSAEQIATTTAEQSERIAAVYDEMNDLSATIEEIATTADEVADRSSAAVNVCKVGSRAASEAIEEMNEVQERAAEIDGVVADLVEEVDRIGEVVDLIDEIADQTNLLALNASVEAATAGDGGDGFAVVADEVKALAGETAEATDEVEGLIEEVQDSAGRTADEMADLRERVDEGTDTVEDALAALEEIVDSVEAANESVQTINGATDDQAESTSEVVSMVDQVTDLSEETDAEADQVAAAAQEQTASVEQVATATAEMADRAHELTRLVETFEVGAEGGDRSDLGDVDPHDGHDPHGAETHGDADGGPAGEEDAELEPGPEPAALEAPEDPVDESGAHSESIQEDD